MLKSAVKCIQKPGNCVETRRFDINLDEVIIMDAYELTALITAFAIAIAKATPNNDELAVISLAYSQLSDALDFIIAERALLSTHPQTDIPPILALP